MMILGSTDTSVLFGAFTKFGTAVTGVLLRLLLDVGKLAKGTRV